MNLKPRVLYIEDDVDSRRLVSRVLTTSGYEVFLAADGLEGVTVAKDSRPQLVLMDINLPSLDGRVVTTRLRGLPGLEIIPIVALTANTSPGSRELALAAGCTGFLTKPIDVDLLPEQVESFLNGQKHTLHPQIFTQSLARHAQDVVVQLETKVRELEKINERLYRLDRLKSDFITLASHELRTPLTLVSGYSQLLEMQLSQMQDEEINEQTVQKSLDSARKLNRGIERLARVVDEVIGVSRIATNRLDLFFAPVQLNEVILQIVDELAPIMLDRQLQINLDGLGGSVVVPGDADHIRTAVTNIIENAIKYTPDGGMITLAAENKGEAVIVKVQDTGIGIPQADQPFIFDQFYVVGSIDNHSSSKYGFMGGGLGVGLAITRGIIEAHNGRIWVESEKRDLEALPGSTFHLLFPTV
ncbi:MAG: response regulator [Anaerolineae bacterium]|nr:response regulator [Anaerolineae bacterium]